jgi:uncharacterized protein with von Willebrand factor type A (vWA) domain
MVSTPGTLDDVDLLARLATRFSDGLRSRGIAVSTAASIDAARALRRIDLTARDQVRAALRATLVGDAQAATVLDELVDRFLPAGREERSRDATGTGSAAAEAGTLVAALDAGDAERLREFAERAVDQHAGLGAEGTSERSTTHHTNRVLRGMGLDGLLRELLARRADELAGASEAQRRVATAEAAAAVRSLADLIARLVAERMHVDAALERQPGDSDLTDLADLPILAANSGELDALRRTLRPLARRLAARIGRRRRRGRGSLDMRRTLRASMSTGGIPVTPVLHRRRPTRPDLAVLCDVSGSVAQFAPFTLALLHALSGEFRHVRSWVFIDGIVEITDLLADSNGMLDARHLLGRHGLVRGDGRSDYAAALGEFLSRWPDAVSPRTTVLVIGDARSHGRAPATAELDRLRQATRHLFWFNPEPAAEWDDGDSVATAYRARTDEMFEVATLRQLEAAVAALR